MDKTTGELFLAEMFDHFNTNVAQIRVYEGMEPPHFLQLFKGKLIVLNGADLNGTVRKLPSTFVLKVVGSSSYTAKAIQVSNKTSHSPTDCYIIKGGSGSVWVWCGQSSTGDSREMAKSIAGMVGEPNLVMEGAETDDFYESAGEKFIGQMKLMQHLTEVSLCSAWDKARVNLYLASLVQGQIQLEQIFAFNQMDLTPENIYLLDAGSIIYVWLGSLVASEQKQAAWIIALHLISIHPIPRNITVPIAVIKQSYEPITFIGFFDKWDTKLFEVNCNCERKNCFNLNFELFSDLQNFRKASRSNELARYTSRTITSCDKY
jgi:villin 1